MSKDRLAHIGPSDRKWLEFGLRTITGEYLPKFDTFFSEMGALLSPASLVNSGFPYQKYLEGATDFYMFDDGIGRMHQVMSGAPNLTITRLLPLKVDAPWEVAVARASFLADIATKNRILAGNRFTPALESPTPTVSPDPFKNTLDQLHQSIQRLSSAFSIENFAKNGIPTGRIKGFQNQLIALHRTATRVEGAMSKREIEQFCRDLGYSPDNIEGALQKLMRVGMKEDSNPLPGFLSLLYTPGTQLLGLIDSKRIDVY